MLKLKVHLSTFSPSMRNMNFFVSILKIYLLPRISELENYLILFRIFMRGKGMTDMTTPIRKARAGLTDIKIRKAEPREKRYQIYEPYRLYCEVMTTGARKWRVRFQIDGKDARKSLGDFPAIGLAEARKRRDEFKMALQRGEDPRKPVAPETTFGMLRRNGWQGG